MDLRPPDLEIILTLLQHHNLVSLFFPIEASLFDLLLE
jgi:hypothetical protein